MSKGCDPLRAYARIQDMIFRNRSYRSSAGGNGGFCVKSAFFLYVPAFFVVEKPSEKHEIRTDGKWKSFTAGLCVVLFLRFSTVRLPGFLPGYSHITCKRQVIHTPFSCQYSTDCGIRVFLPVLDLRLELFYLALEARIVQYHLLAYLDGIYHGRVIPVEIRAYLVL